MADRDSRQAEAVFHATLWSSALAYSLHAESFLHAKAAALAVGTVALALATPGAGGVGLHRHFAPLWIWLVWGVLVAAWRGNAPVYAIETALPVAIALLAAGLVGPLLRNPLSANRVYASIAGSACAVGVLAIAQRFGFLSWWFPAFAHYDQTMYSVFGNQNLLGGYCALGFVTIVSVQCRIRQSAPGAVAAASVAFVLLVALLWSGSRSGWLAAIAGLGVLGCAFVGRGLRAQRRLPWHRDPRVRWGIATFAVLVAVAGWIALPVLRARFAITFEGGDVGFRIRLWIWDATLRMIADAPILGHGLGQFDALAPRYLGEALLAPGGDGHRYNELEAGSAHSDGLQVWAETGVLGLACWIWMAVRAWGRISRTAMAGLGTLGVFAMANATVQSPPHLLVALLFLVQSTTASAEPEARTPGVRHSLAVAALCCAVAYGWTVLVPGMLQRYALDRHLEGADAAPAYARALAWPWPMPQTAYYAGMWHYGQGGYTNTCDLLDTAGPAVDTGGYHLLRAQSLEALGESEAAHAAARAWLDRWPWSREAYALARRTAPDERVRAALDAHAERWFEPEPR